jgi:hypothetical protein
MARRNTDWDGDRVDPIRGSNRPTEFFKSNFKMMGVGSIFRTPKAKFSPKTIHTEAKKAGFVVRVDQEGPWLKVTVTGKIPPQKPTPKKQDSYTGAGKVYHPTNDTPSNPTPDIFS